MYKAHRIPAFLGINMAINIFFSEKRLHIPRAGDGDGRYDVLMIICLTAVGTG